MTHSLLIAVAFAFGGVQGPSTPPATSSASYTEVVEGLRTLSVDGDRSADVTDFVLTRDGAQVVLRSGVLHMLSPLEGRTPGAVFVGEGSFMLVPPIDVERAHVERSLEGGARAELEGAVLIFNDETFSELTTRLSFRPALVDEKASDLLKEALDYLDERAAGLDGAMVSAFLNPGTGDFLHVHLKTLEGSPWYYRLDRAQREEVAFGRKALRGNRFDVVSSFHLRDDYVSGRMLTEGEPRLATLNHYDVDMTIKGNLDVEAFARVQVDSVVAGARWVPLSLFGQLHVDSVSWSGTPGEFVREGRQAPLWVEIPESVRDAGRGTLELWYRGDLLERVQGWIVLRSSAGWYPRYGRSSATFDLTLHVPDDYQVAGSGRRVTASTEGDVLTTRWVVDEPAPHASFNIGRFEERVFGEAVPVTVQYSKDAHERLQHALSRSSVTLLRQEDPTEAVGFDVSRSMDFFAERYGPAPAPAFLATEIPALHGQAFPGMIHLSWTTFQWTGGEGYAEIFRAHEVAHQWWGLAVDYSSYHDVWLSEGLAEFSGLWYMQAVLGNPLKYRQRMAEYRDEILRRKDDTGPIWLGYRVIRRGYQGSDDYQVIVYQKGAWVFHMLRALMTDLETLDDAPFQTMMKDLYSRYRGERVSTEQFRALVEEHMGADMGWFFRQWVYGTEIPTYTFSWHGESTPSGEYKVTVRIRQEDVSEKFENYLPVFLSFGDEGWARLRVRVQGPVTEVELPLLPREPDDVVLDDVMSMLAQVKTEAWR